MESPSVCYKFTTITYFMSRYPRFSGRAKEPGYPNWFGTNGTLPKKLGIPSVFVLSFLRVCSPERAKLGFLSPPNSSKMDDRAKNNVIAVKTAFINGQREPAAGDRALPRMAPRIRCIRQSACSTRRGRAAERLLR